MQQVIVILIVAACVIWLGYYAWRFFTPRKGSACGGGCCDAGSKPAETKPAGHTVFISSDDLARRVQARKRA